MVKANIKDDFETYVTLAETINAAHQEWNESPVIFKISPLSVSLPTLIGDIKWRSLPHYQNSPFIFMGARAAKNGKGILVIFDGFVAAEGERKVELNLTKTHTAFGQQFCAHYFKFMHMTIDESINLLFSPNKIIDPASVIVPVDIHLNDPIWGSW